MNDKSRMDFFQISILTCFTSAHETLYNPSALKCPYTLCPTSHRKLSVCNKRTYQNAIIYSSYLLNDPWPVIFIRPFSFNPINRKNVLAEFKNESFKISE